MHEQTGSEVLETARKSIPVEIWRCDITVGGHERVKPLYRRVNSARGCAGAQQKSKLGTLFANMAEAKFTK